MLKSLRQNYFSNRNYTCLYLHNAFKGAAFLTMFLFTGGWLYKIGLEIHWIVLYHMANFTFMGLFSPLATRLAYRYGLLTTFSISFLLYFIALLFLSLGSINILFIIPGVLCSSLAHGLHNPVDIILQAFYIKNQNRGRAFSVINAITAFSAMLMIIASGWMLENLNFWWFSALCATLWGISLVCLIFMEDRIKGQDKITAKQLYKQIFAKEFRPYLGIALGFQFIIIAGLVFAPLILYLATDSFQSMSIIAALAVLFQAILFLIHGHWVDKTTTMAPLRFACLINAIGLLIYGFLANIKIMLFFADTLQRTGFLMFTGTLFPRLHKDILSHKKPLVPFGAALHMAICFWEFVTLGILATGLFIFGEKLLPYCMLLCAFGGFIAYIYGKKLKKPQ